MQQGSTEEMVTHWAIYIDPRTSVRREQVQVTAAEAASLRRLVKVSTTFRMSY